MPTYLFTYLTKNININYASVVLFCFWKVEVKLLSKIVVTFYALIYWLVLKLCILQGSVVTFFQVCWVRE